MSKSLKLTGTILVIAAIVAWLYPSGSEFMETVRTHAYPYAYSAPNLTPLDTSSMSAAEAVPILMYHGVIARGPVASNTSRRNFIKHMEMLKENGYETISIAEYDAFRNGTFTLPPKPIIITFDDGRKDSFYTVDETLKALGFKATMFVATVKPNTNDSFYLSWDELRAALASGRWEMEAHGRHSHDEMISDAEGSLGTFLVTRIYRPGIGLESIDEYRARVDADYAAGKADLKEYLGVDANYFAVPLNSYGKLELSNYENAYEDNLEFTRKHFKLAFVEALADTQARESFYNYRDTAPYDIKRLEVKDMSVADLKASLEHFVPRPPALSYKSPADLESFMQDTVVVYGSGSTARGITLTSRENAPAARMLIGDWGWRNYEVRMNVSKTGRSVSLLAYYTNKNNFLMLDWGEQSVRLVEMKDGTERQLALINAQHTDSADLEISIIDGTVRASFNDRTLTSSSRTSLSRGSSGISVWDPDGNPGATIRSFEIVSLQ